MGHLVHEESLLASLFSIQGGLHLLITLTSLKSFVCSSAVVNVGDRLSSLMEYHGPGPNVPGRPRGQQEA